MHLLLRLLVWREQIPVIAGSADLTGKEFPFNGLRELAGKALIPLMVFCA